MNDLDSLSKNFLIKSHGKITGPYAIQEIVELMVSKRVAGFDEVQGAGGIWRLIKEDPIFADAFREVIANLEDSECTMDITATIENTALTISQKMNLQKKQDTVSFVENNDSKINDYKNSAETINIKDKSEKNQIRTAGYKKKRKNELFFLYMSVAIFFVVIIYQISNEQHLKLDDVKASSYDVNQLMYIGEYEKALITLDKYDSTKESELLKIEAYMHLQKYTEAQRLISEVYKKFHESNILAKLHNWLGIVYLHKQLFNDAKKEFDKSLLLYPEYESAKLNRIDSKLLMDDMTDLKKDLLLNVKTEDAVSTNLFLRYEIVYFSEEQLDTEHQLFNEISNFSKVVFDQKQELLFFLAFILLENNYTQEANQLFETALSIDPEFFLNNVQSSELYHPNTVVQKLIVLLKRQEFKYSQNPYYQASLAILYYKLKSSLAFRKHLDLSLQLGSEKKSIQALQYLVHLNFKENLLMEKILSGNMEELEANLIGKYCEKIKNYPCSEKVWDYLALLNPNSVSSIVGKARLLLVKKQTNIVKNLINRGIGMAPRYIPVRKLEMEVGQ